MAGRYSPWSDVRVTLCICAIALNIAWGICVMVNVRNELSNWNRQPTCSLRSDRSALSGLAMALTMHRLQSGEAPPRSGPENIRAHLRTCFSDEELAEFEQWLESRQMSLDTLDEDETLVFWLGGLYERDGTTPLKLPDSLGYKPVIDVCYQFPTGALTDRDGDGWWEYNYFAGYRSKMVFVLTKSGKPGIKVEDGTTYDASNLPSRWEFR